VWICQKKKKKKLTLKREDLTPDLIKNIKKKKRVRTNVEETNVDLGKKKKESHLNKVRKF
jgi:hypothetical protein